MGKIAEYQSNPVQPSADMDAPDLAAAPFQILGKAAGMMNEHADRLQQARDMSYVSSKTVDLELQAKRRMDEWQKTHANDPLGKEEELHTLVQRDIDDMAAAAPSDRARAALQQMGDDVKRKVSGEGYSWAQRQTVINIGNEIDRSSQSLQLAAYRSSDPNKVQDLFRQHDLLVETAKVSLSPEAVSKINEVGKREIVANLMTGMIDNDRLREAQRVLDSKQYDQILGADGTRQAYEMIQRKRDALQSRAEKLELLKDSNPWKFLAETGAAKEARPVEFGGDAKSISDSFIKREQFIVNNSKKHGMDIPFLAPQEVDAFTDGFLKMSPQVAASVMGGIDDKTPERLKAAVGRQVFEKEPALSAAMMIAGHGEDGESSARGIVEGMKLLRKGPGESGRPVNAPKQATIEAEFDAYVGVSLADPNARLAVKQAATALMTSTLYSKGQDAEGFTPADFHAAVKSVMGPVHSINGKKTASFRKPSGKFIDSEEFEDLIDGLTDEKVQAAQGDIPRTGSGEPINLRKARSRLTYQAASANGTYWIYMDDKPARDMEGKLFKLNLAALANGGKVKRVGGNSK